MATNFTVNLKLAVPDFDQIPWDTDVNTNWTVLDAAVGLFASIPNLAGLWKNSTAYSYGTSVIDGSDSSIWLCVQSHTSSAAPQTFVAERSAYPARWTQSASGAQFYATQAANSANSAANSATAAANSAAAAAGKLPLTGGTMTGFIVLNADPTAALHPVTKQYVDSRIAGTGYLPLTGGTLTGPLQVGGNGVSYTVAGANMHAIAFSWNGAATQMLVDGTNQGLVATQGYVNASYLPISGGTITGNLTVNANSVANTFQLSSSGTLIAADSTYMNFHMDSSNYLLQYLRQTGTLRYVRADSAVLFSIDSNGSVTATASITAATNIVSNGGMYARGGNVYWGGSDRSHLTSDNSSYTTITFLDNYRWGLNWNTGLLTWYRYDSTSMLSLDINGNLSLAGGVFASGIFNFGLTVSGGSRLLQYDGNNYWYWNANFDLVWHGGAGDHLFMRYSDKLIYNVLAPMGGNGAYQNISDERTKKDIAASVVGLAEVMRIEPIDFLRIGGSKPEIGFSAQQLESIIPAAVHTIGFELPDGSGGLDDENPTKAVSIEPIVAALVNGMKDLNNRLSALEAP